MYENNMLANKNKATSISGNESPPGAKTTTSPKVKVTTESPPGVKTTTSPNLEATTESSLPEAKDNTESTSIKAKAITGLSSPNPEVTTESPLNAEDTTGPKETESSLPTERTTESYKVQESILGVDNCIKNNDLLLPEIYTEYDILLPGSQLNLNQQKEVVHALTTARSIQNLQVQGQGSEEELSVLDDEDGIITSGRREWTYPLKTTSSIFDNNNKITDNPFINLLPLIKSEMSKRFPPQKLNDDNIFSDFQAASDINSRKTMHPMNGFTSTSMNPLQQKQFVHSKSTSFDNTFSDLDPLHNK
ncbi:8702_t:CDS:2 [Entrophospora sp. SA101]|nr:8702_t:CDS:2 [Entrophospora sp. SA101]